MPATKSRSSIRTRGTRTENGRSGKNAVSASTKSSNGKATKGENGSANEISQLEKLFTDSLKDIYWAEKHLTKALPKMQKAATSQKLQQAFEEHLQQTQTHVERLEQVFEILGKKAQAKKCNAMAGIL